MVQTNDQIRKYVNLKVWEKLLKIQESQNKRILPKKRNVEYVKWNHMSETKNMKTVKVYKNKKGTSVLIATHKYDTLEEAQSAAFALSNHPTFWFKTVVQ